MPATPNQNNLNGMCPSASIAQVGTVVANLVNTVNTLIAKVNELETSYVSHKHHCDGSQAGAYTTTAPVTDVATIVGGTAIALVNTANVAALAVLG